MRPRSGNYDPTALDDGGLCVHGKTGRLRGMVVLTAIPRLCVGRAWLDCSSLDSMYSPAMDGLFVIRLVGVLIAAAGMGALVANLRRPRSWASPTYAWATRDRQLVLDVALIVIGVVIALAAVSLAR